MIRTNIFHPKTSDTYKDQNRCNVKEPGGADISWGATTLGPSERRVLGMGDLVRISIIAFLWKLYSGKDIRIGSRALVLPMKRDGNKWSNTIFKNGEERSSSKTQVRKSDHLDEPKRNCY